MYSNSVDEIRETLLTIISDIEKYVPLNEQWTKEECIAFQNTLDGKSVSYAG